MSTPSNLAEGFRQGALRAYLRHVRIAAGSTAELETQVQIATEMKLWLPDHAMEIRHLVESTGQMLTALIKSLEAKAVREGLPRQPR